MIENGNPTEATREVYDATTEDSVAATTMRLLKDENVMSEVRMALDAAGVTPDWIIERHVDLVTTSQNDMVKTKNLEDLGEMRGMYPKGPKTAVDVSREGIRVEWGGDDK